jgi:hypothetical protein
MATRNNEQDLPAEQRNPVRDVPMRDAEEEIVRGRADADEDDAADEFEDTEDLDDEQEEDEGSF